MKIQENTYKFCLKKSCIIHNKFFLNNHAFYRVENAEKPAFDKVIAKTFDKKKLR